MVLSRILKQIVIFPGFSVPTYHKLPISHYLENGARREAGSLRAGDRLLLAFDTY